MGWRAGGDQRPSIRWERPSIQAHGAPTADARSAGPTAGCCTRTDHAHPGGTTGTQTRASGDEAAEDTGNGMITHNGARPDPMPVLWIDHPAV